MATRGQVMAAGGHVMAARGGQCLNLMSYNSSGAMLKLASSAPPA